jgi:hypothetical protein
MGTITAVMILQVHAQHRSPRLELYSETSGLCCSLLLEGTQPRAMPFLHLFCKNNSAAKVAAKVSDLHKLVLDRL